MAKSCLCCRLMMSSVSSFLSGRSFSEEKQKKPAVSSLFFLFVLYLSLSIFLLFFVNDNKKDLPLNVQDVFSHT